MVPQSLQADAPYADVAVHGDGLISLQYRLTAGGPIREVQAPIKAPARVQLERHSNLFTFSMARRDEPLQPQHAP